MMKYTSHSGNDGSDWIKRNDWRRLVQWDGVILTLNEYHWTHCLLINFQSQSKPLSPPTPPYPAPEVTLTPHAERQIALERGTGAANFLIAYKLGKLSFQINKNLRILWHSYRWNCWWIIDRFVPQIIAVYPNKHPALTVSPVSIAAVIVHMT